MNTLPRRDAVLELLASRERALSAREIAARLHVAEPAFPGFARFLESLAQVARCGRSAATATRSTARSRRGPRRRPSARGP